MRVLLTGATGYIARRLLPILLAEGHEVICCVRDAARFDTSRSRTDRLSVITVNFLDSNTLSGIPEDIDAAYYLIHSMSSTVGEFDKMEKQSAVNFRERMNVTRVRQVIYLSGIVNTESLSKHLGSRKTVEDELSRGSYHLTTLRAGIILGSGSASFEIIRDLVEKLPVMVAPRWLKTRSQPIAVQNVIEYLSGVLMREDTFDGNYDIGGPDILTYKDMLLRFAAVRNLRRKIWVVPVMTPKLSSYWLYFVTSTSYKLAVNLVDSMKVEVICRENDLHERLRIKLMGFDEAVRNAFDRIEQQAVPSSWTDALSLPLLERGLSDLVKVPSFGCFHDIRKRRVTDEQAVLGRLWSIGGRTGWYYANWLWGLRGFLDKLSGGVGLRRGRKNNSEISQGDSLDFWRVLYADREQKKLLLYAEMKLPGEAWLEWKIEDETLVQTATFRPLGLKGRLYWYSVMPFHELVFRGMIKRISL
ncbi:MAG: SDR family oxidoreductase [Bacteroidales bacterium]|nr:SDR family oxidoreductase [Bacteroidales bacterium]MDT8372702.1 SDR family oxidoreductase [Bacteroidales bacterium]